ncbi:MAG: hypothetical protein WC622_01060 [Pedobacter sp.]|jgi:hypothetical protein|uniref:hypothetical protein n=1 Tax=Pedobacter sp. TaxID=1411316 RepID=UPI003563B1CF
MISKKKQAELDRYRSISLATIDYLLKLNGGMIVYDGDDFMTEFYNIQKIETEKYHHEGKLDRLKARLTQQINSLQRMVDLDFEAYIKTTTGFDIDIFDALRKRVNIIIENKAIRNDKEMSDIFTMRRYYELTLKNKKENKILNSLIIEYSKKSTRKNTGHSHVINRVEKDGIEEVRMMSYTGPKLKHYKEQEELSPDGKLKLSVTQWSAGGTNSTTISVTFPKTHGEIYRVDDICPDITAFWKDYQTVVIETRKDYLAYPKFKQLRSFDNVINIEYVER